MSLRLVIISDTHTLHHKIQVPEGDVLIHAGDFTGRGKPHELIYFNRWLEDLPFRKDRILLVPGNHDMGLEEYPELWEECVSNGTPLVDDGVTIEGVKFWGSPYTPTFNNWGYMRERGDDIQKHWDLIPSDTDVLITHGPPAGVLDEIPWKGGVGCGNLLNTIQHRLKSLKVHIFGHIHESAGRVELNGVHFINASQLNGDYDLAHEPIVLDI